ncbi:MAG: hypothetical protein IR153_03550 [Flavobacterium sp.]|nr:hypothetical protein [Flavobacterium sp.]
MNNRNLGDGEQVIDLSNVQNGLAKAGDRLKLGLFQAIQFTLRNAVIILSLIILGIALGYFLDRSQKMYDHQLIVSPNFRSTDYLYSRIDVLNAKISERDTTYLKGLGFKNPKKLKAFSIEPIVDVYPFINSNEQNYRLLQLMAEDGDINKIVEAKTTSKNYTYHTIVFSSKNKVDRESTIEPLMKYLNNSSYFSQLQQEHLNNTRLKIAANEVMISQIDGILNSFDSSKKGSNNSSLVYYSENTQLNEVIKTKNDLLEEQAYHRINLISMDKIVKENSAFLNVESQNAVGSNMKLLLPILFTLSFILIYMFRSFYRNQLLRYKLANNNQP